MDGHDHRILNGILKARRDLQAPEQASALLARDIEVVAPPERIVDSDLWPCVWALASVLGRQFHGRVYLDCGLDRPLPSPGELPSNCIFGRGGLPTADRIHVGAAPSVGAGLIGDARGNAVGYGALLPDDVPAHPIASFALAGYLGFSALANAIGIPPFRADLAKRTHVLSFDPSVRVLPCRELSLIGLGHLGHAYLALLWFLRLDDVHLHLVDKERFGPENYATQILMARSEDAGQFKAPHLAKLLRERGVDAVGARDEVTWGWSRPEAHPATVLVGVDDLDVRRMILASGYEWFFEAGLGDDFTRPRFTWHVLRGGDSSGTAFRQGQSNGALAANPALERALRDTPGECGWLTFKATTASAPSMGLVAAAHVIGELLSERRQVAGSGLVWSPVLPTWRQFI